MLSIQLLEHTYVPAREIPIPELPSLGRHRYHICVSLNAEHTIIGPHVSPTYGDSYTRIALVGSTYIYISQMSQSLCWAYSYWNTPMPQVWRFLYPNYRHWVDIYITDVSVFMLSIQLLEHTYARGMEIPIPELPSLGRHIYHRCVSLYDEHTIIGTHLCPSYGDSYTRISVIGSTYITDAPASMLSIKLLENTYVSVMEIPIPEITSLGRHIYHGWVSLSAEHTILRTHLCPRYGDSYTRITILVPTYISQMRQSQCWAYNNWNTPMSQVWRFLYPNYRHWVDIYIYHGYISLYTEHAIIGTHLCPRYGDSYTQITVIGSTYISQMPQSMLSIQLL